MKVLIQTYKKVVSQQKTDILDLDIPYDTHFKMKSLTTQYGNNKKKRDYDVLKSPAYGQIS